MSFGTIVIGLAERDGDDDPMELATRLADADGAELVRCHVDLRHPWVGSPARGLVQRIELHEADLVVVGSGRRAAAGRLLPTRTARQLVEHAPCPVAIAPHGYQGSGAFLHIGVAYDGTPEADRALELAYALAARDGAAVTLYWTIPDGRVAYAGIPRRKFDAVAQRTCGVVRRTRSTRPPTQLRTASTRRPSCAVVAPEQDIANPATGWSTSS